MFFGTFSLAVVCQPARSSSSTADLMRIEAVRGYRMRPTSSIKRPMKPMWPASRRASTRFMCFDVEHPDAGCPARGAGRPASGRKSRSGFEPAFR
ncbi:MAG: hypothetical protein E5Y16_10545, partial [Mesorhizobium sp.]